MDNNRKHFRLELHIPLKAEFKIISINNFRVNSKYTNIFIKDLSAGGARIHSKLNFPADGSLLLEIGFIILNTQFKLPGTIMWKKLYLQNLVIEYGIQFSLTENQQKLLLSKLHLLSTLLKNKNRLSNYNFCSDEEITAFYKRRF